MLAQIARCRVPRSAIVAIRAAVVDDPLTTPPNRCFVSLRLRRQKAMSSFPLSGTEFGEKLKSYAETNIAATR
jgi:hypothetical protein